jgi:hypothetical protein
MLVTITANNSIMTYETKIGHYSKIIWHGTFVFLVYENGEMKKYLTYQYSIDKKNKKTIVVNRVASILITEKNEAEYERKEKDLKTTKEYNSEIKKQIEDNKNLQKIYNEISPRFLNISNDEKIKLLDSLSQITLLK